MVTKTRYLARRKDANLGTYLGIGLLFGMSYAIEKSKEKKKAKARQAKYEAIKAELDRIKKESESEWKSF